MLSREEIEKSILELEEKDTTFATCEKLAWLYVVKDHLIAEKKKAKIAQGEESEFLKVIDGKEETRVWTVLNELMETLKIMNPKTYHAVILKLENLD